MKVRFMPPLNNYIGASSFELQDVVNTLGELTAIIKAKYLNAEHWLSDPNYPLLVIVDNKLLPLTEESEKIGLSAEGEVVFMFPMSGG